MYKIALVCEHGASTGMCVRKMIEAASKAGMECEIAAYSAPKLGAVIDEMDCVLLGPQLSFKLDRFKQDFPAHAGKMAVINSMDFGMMNGEKILNDAVDLIQKNQQ